MIAEAAPLARQQLVARVVDLLASHAGEAGIGEGLVIDVVDALRAELVRRAAAALGHEGVTSAPAWRRAAYHARSELGYLLARRPPALNLAPGAILLLPRHRGVDLLPVASALSERGGRPLLLRTAHDPDWAHPAPRVLLGAEAPRAALPRAARALSVIVPQISTSVRSAGLTGAEATRVTSTLTEVLATELPEVFRVAGGLLRVARESEARALVVGNHYTLDGRAAALTARALGLPVATIEHGSIFVGDPAWQRVPADLVCLWGEPTRARLLAEGVPASSMIVTGSPKLDAQLAAARALPPGEGGVLVATSGPGDKVSEAEHVAFVTMLFEVARAVPELSFHVKLHRKDRVRYYEHAQALHPTANVRWAAADATSFGGDIYAELRRARVLLTIQSTAALDAMLMAVPVVVADIGRRGRERDAPFLAHARVAHDVAGLAAALTAAAAAVPHPSDHTGRAYVATHYAHLGQAAPRAAEAILALAALDREGRSRR